MPTNNKNNASIEEGIIDTTDVDVTQAPATSSSMSNRNSKIFISVVVIAMSIVAVAIALSTGKKQIKAKEVNSSPIVSGTEATEDRYSYMAYFWHPEYICDGSMIAKDVVLTAAHCANSIDFTTSIMLGRHNLIGDPMGVGEFINPKRKLRHPDFDKSTYDADFMLVFLDRAFNASNVDVVTLNSDPSFPSVGQEVTATGWGDTSSGGTTSDVLLHVDLNIISDEECADTEGTQKFEVTVQNNVTYVEEEDFSFQDNITQYSICAFGENGKDTCQGDSGGPLVVAGGIAGEDIQVGVVSRGIGCGYGVPGIYSRVSSAYEWIQDEVCKGSDYASEAGFDCSTSAVYSLYEGLCISENECSNLYHDENTMFASYHAGNYPEYGCFRKGLNLFWGYGGSAEQEGNLELSGAKERVLCTIVMYSK